MGAGWGSKPPRDQSRAARVGLTLLILAGFGFVGGLATRAAFSDTTLNAGNGFTAGTVKIDDNDAGSALLSLSDATPGATDTGCIKVTYNGSLDSTVRVFGTTTGSGLDQYIDLKVTRGTYSSDPGFDSCSNFTADPTDHIGSGSGVVYDGTLQGFPDSYAAGLVDPTSGAPETWTAGEVHVYRFTVTLQDDAGAAGLDATQTFTWEARNT